MKIEYRKGDLLRTDIPYVLHGCNCRGVMGAGVAKAIRNKYPKAYQDYRDVYESSGLLLGTKILSHQSDGKTIVNAMTQENYGTGVQVSYWAISTIFKSLNFELPFADQIALPMIGSGLAGGDWNVIEALIEQSAETYVPVVYYL